MLADLALFYLFAGAYLAWVFHRAPQREDFTDQYEGINLWP